MLREGIGRLHFAGEHTSYAFMGYMEGALNSGAAAAKRIAVRRRCGEADAPRGSTRRWQAEGTSVRNLFRHVQRLIILNAAMCSYRRRCNPPPVVRPDRHRPADAAVPWRQPDRDRGRVAESRRPRYQIEQAMRPSTGVTPREGVAAAIVIDVSGSMDDRVTGEDGRRARKIDVARRRARDWSSSSPVMPSEHQGEPVSLGIFEFSRRDNQPDCRPIMPMGPPDRAQADAALARLDPRAARRSARRWSPRSWRSTRPASRAGTCWSSPTARTPTASTEDVAAAIAKRPEAEKPSIYFVAFDIEARRFNGVRDAGGLCCRRPTRAS